MKLRLLGVAPLALFPFALRGCPPAKPAVRYANCAALHAVYPHGVARSGARDHTTGATPVTTFVVNSAVYNVNTNLDRDRDGVACEQR